MTAEKPCFEGAGLGISRHNLLKSQHKHNIAPGIGM